MQLLTTDLGPEDIEEYAAHIRRKFGKDLPYEKILKLLEAELKPKKVGAGPRRVVSCRRFLLCWHRSLLCW